MSLPVLRRGSCHSRRVLGRCLATHAPTVEKDCSSITPPYAELLQKLECVRKLLNNRPLTLAEKILYSHLADPEKSLSRGGKIRGETYLQLSPQRVAMQDASAQLSLCCILFIYWLTQGAPEWRCESRCVRELFFEFTWYQIAIYERWALSMRGPHKHTL